MRLLAPGAKGVLRGRAWPWALAAQGVDRMLAMLVQEMRVAMTPIGVASVLAITGDILSNRHD